MVYNSSKYTGLDNQDVSLGIRRFEPGATNNVVVPSSVSTTSYTATVDDDVILVDDDTAGAEVTVTLPAAAGATKPLEIKKLGTTANVVIDGDGSETIDGGLTATLTTQYESLTLVSNGSNWYIV